MKKILLPIVFLSLAAIASCASMNEAECVTADWTGIGYEDGARGRDASYISNHRSACAEHGVTPDIQQYMDGYQEGIAYYCRPENGYNLGRRGGSNAGLCPSNLSAAFNAAYNEGRELYRLSSAIAQAGRTIEANNEQIDDMRETIKEKELTLVSDDTPQAQRTILLQEVRELEQEIGRLEAETLELERRRAVLTQDLEDLEASYSRF